MSHPRATSRRPAARTGSSRGGFWPLTPQSQLFKFAPEPQCPRYRLGRPSHKPHLHRTSATEPPSTLFGHQDECLRFWRASFASGDFRADTRPEVDGRSKYAALQSQPCMGGSSAFRIVLNNGGDAYEFEYQVVRDFVRGERIDRVDQHNGSLPRPREISKALNFTSQELQVQYLPVAPGIFRRHGQCDKLLKIR